MEEQDIEKVGSNEEKSRKTVPHDFADTTLLPFPRRIKKPTMDVQLRKFVEVIKKLNINIRFLRPCMYQPTPRTSRTSSTIKDLYPPRIWSSL
jgi:hypothetical protein